MNEPQNKNAGIFWHPFRNGCRSYEGQAKGTLNVLQSVVECCSVLQSVAVCCSVIIRLHTRTNAHECVGVRRRLHELESMTKREWWMHAHVWHDLLTCRTAHELQSNTTRERLVDPLCKDPLCKDTCLYTIHHSLEELSWPIFVLVGLVSYKIVG